MQTITVNVVADNQFERNETFFVNLSGAVNGIVTKTQGVGTIRNDDGIFVTGPGPNNPNGPLVKVYNAADGRFLYQFLAYVPNFTGRCGAWRWAT